MLKQVQHDKGQGLLLCARYSVAPNFFGYCGPDKNLNLVDHLKDNIADSEVSHILSEFETLYHYLRLIAVSNKIADIFDKRVVEAYWVGNSLLHNITDSSYSSLLKEKFLDFKRINQNNFQIIRNKITNKFFLPHHSFHVFNIFKRTGNDPSFHTLNTMDECRIGWGKIVQSSLPADATHQALQAGKCKVQNFILVKTKQLIMKAGKLMLDSSIIKEVKIDYKGKSFSNSLKVGDWISFHWGFACDVLSQMQIRNLQYYTEQSINFYNHP